MNVDSLKIEGRMRSIYYIATVVSIYRSVIDNYYSGDYKYNLEYEKILDRVANRDSCVQFFDGNYSEECSYYNNRVEVSNQDFLGVVLEYDENTKLVKLEQRNYFKKGDVVEFFGPNNIGFEYTINEIFDEDMNIIDVVRHPRQIVYLKVDEVLNKYDFMRVKI